MRMVDLPSLCGGRHTRGMSCRMILGSCHETPLCSMFSLSRPCPWTMVRAGNLDPMYFLGSVNMDVPVVAKQSEVGISYSGPVPSPLVPKKHLNIPNVVPQFWFLVEMCLARSSTRAEGPPRTKHAIGLDDQLYTSLLSNFGFLVRFPWFRVSILIAMDEVNSCVLR